MNTMSNDNNDVSPTNNNFNQKQYDSMMKVFGQLQNFAKKLIDLGKMKEFDSKCQTMGVDDSRFNELNCSNDPAVLDVKIKNEFSDVNTMPNDDEFQKKIDTVLKQIDGIRYNYNNLLYDQDDKPYSKDKLKYAKIANHNVINVLNASKILNALIKAHDSEKIIGKADDSEKMIGKADDIVTDTDVLMKFTGVNYDKNHTNNLYSSLDTKINDLNKEYDKKHPKNFFGFSKTTEEKVIRVFIQSLISSLKKTMGIINTKTSGGSNRKQTIRRRIRKSNTKKRKSNTKKRK